ncbi:MAG: GatB/YqeY domain-containing protein [SAR202 cluster bacterium]|nr:GatB/YqeY domain-containing protein [SAR202 cluster bacterium]|tara:strand:+ start:56042 stop:56485 length:444 start_codon:yes stop_codon:yes gene_type:complete
MTLQDQLNDDLKTAMRSQDTLTKDTIRLMRAAIKNAEIEKRNELSEEAVIEVLSKMAKQYRDSITTYTDNGREDLAKKEKDELEVLIRYLPAQLSESELKDLISKSIAQTGAIGMQDRGKVMALVMPQVKGRADGSVINSIVGELLS